MQVLKFISVFRNELHYQDQFAICLTQYVSKEKAQVYNMFTYCESI